MSCNYMKLFKVSSLCLAVIISYNSVADAALKCENPIKSVEAAQNCVTKQILTQGDALYDFVKSKNHLGDIAKCTSSKGIKSYFTDKKVDFINGIQSSKLQNCAVSNRDPDSYNCWVESGPEGCFIPKDQKGSTTERVCIKLGKTTGNLITFFPAECD